MVFEVCPFCRKHFGFLDQFLSRFRKKKPFMMDMDKYPEWMKQIITEHPFGKYDNRKICTKCHKFLTDWRDNQFLKILDEVCLEIQMIKRRHKEEKT
mgnify:CR=1 FL=1